MITAKQIYEWGKAAAVVVGILATAFTVTSGAIEKISSIPGIRLELTAQRSEIDGLKGMMKYLVEAEGRRTGRRYHPDGGGE